MSVFDSKYHQSKGNFLNLHEGLISDLVRKSDGLTEQRLAYQERLVSKYCPEAGYVPTNPIYRAELARLLRFIVEERVRAGTVCLDAPFIAPLSVVREFVGAVSSPIQSLMSPIKTATKIMYSYSDALAECEYARLNIMKDFNNKCASYIEIMNKAYMAEKKDSPSFQNTEMDRAYVSFNRYEHFFLGAGFAAIHHAVTELVSTSERMWRGQEERLAGATIRRGSGIGGDETELIMPLSPLRSAWRTGSNLNRKILSWWNRPSET